MSSSRTISPGSKSYTVLTVADFSFFSTSSKVNIPQKVNTFLCDAECSFLRESTVVDVMISLDVANAVVKLWKPKGVLIGPIN